MSTPPPKKQMTADEIREGIEELAQSGEGADRRWALKTLKGEQQEEAALAPPKSELEVTQRIARILRGAGENLSRAAFVMAHGGYDKRRTLNKMPSPVEPDGLDIDRKKLPKTLRQLYRAYPHLKQSGFPEGYPVGKDPGSQMVFVENKAYATEMEIRRAKAADAVKDIDVLSAPMDGTNAASNTQVLP